MRLPVQGPQPVVAVRRRRARRLRHVVEAVGFDGFLAVMVCVVVGGCTGERRWRQVLARAAMCLAGLVAVMTVLVLHGVRLGFSSWWYAIAGYRISGLNALRC